MTAWTVAAVVAVGGAVVAIIWAVVADTISADVQGWLPHLSHSILKRAAHRLPPTQRDRAEEWHADLDDYRDRPLTMLIVALRVRRNARAIGREATAAALEHTPDFPQDTPDYDLLWFDEKPPRDFDFDG